MKKILTSLTISLIPVMVLADGQTIPGLITELSTFLKTLLPIFVSIAVLYFVWEVIKYTISENEDKKKEAKSGIAWGIIGLFVIICVWGLVKVVENTLGIDETTTSVTLPQFPTY